MTTKQAMGKIKEMMHKDGMNALYARCEKLLNSGGIDKADFNRDEYVLPKIILHCALLDLADQYAPPPGQYFQDVIKNLKHF
jgi:hypothetical protein